METESYLGQTGDLKKKIAELLQENERMKEDNKALSEFNEQQSTAAAKQFLEQAKRISELEQEHTAERHRANHAVELYKDTVERNKQLEELLKEHKLILEILQPWTSGIGWIQHEGHFFNMTDRIKAALNHHS